MEGGTPSDRTAGLHDDMVAMCARHRVPGLAVSLIDGGKIVWSSACGGSDPPITANETIFEAASLSKPVYAHAVLQLVDEGKLKLDEPLGPHLQEPFVPGDARSAAITARMILSHTSGLPNAVPDGKRPELRFAPGARFGYSATGFDYLQTVVERITGEPIDRFTNARVLGPAGMSSSHFGWLDRFAAVRATGYDAMGKAGQTFLERYRLASDEWRAGLHRMHPELNFPPAAAGLYCTADDYARFLVHALTAAPASGGAAFSPQVKVSKRVSWGLGWGLLDAPAGDRWFWHWGNWAGLFQHFVAGNRARGTGIVVLTNSGNGLKLCRELVPRAVGLDIGPCRPLFE
jgi:CubicO group peptidase (beta-lactamase class C family)